MKLLAASTSTLPTARRRAAVLSLSLLLLCLPACAPRLRGVSAAAPLPQPAFLQEGRPVERTLHGGERQELRLAVEAGWYVRLEIEQIGVDVVARLLGPDGATLFTTDDPDGLQDKEVLVVTAHDPQAAPGVYRVTLAARRAAGPGDRERAAAQAAYAEAGHWLGLREEKRRGSIPHLAEAARLWGAAGEIQEESKVLNELGVVQFGLAETQAALASFQEALTLSEKSGDRFGQAAAHSNLAGLPALKDLERLEHYQQALTLYIDLGNRGEQGLVLYGMGVLHRDRGNLDEALRYLTAALPLRRAAGDVGGESFTLFALAIVHQGRGESEQASQCLDKALELAARGGVEEGTRLSILAQFHRYRGELGDALAALQQARASYHRRGNEVYEARVLHQLGALYLDLGDLEGAQRTYEEGLGLVQGRNPEGEVRFLNRLGWVLYLRGDAQLALSYFDRALALSRQKELSAGIAQALGQTGAVYVALGRPEDGLKLLQEELALHRNNGNRSGEAESLLEIGRAWQALGDAQQAAASLGDALDLGRRVGNTGLQAACLYQWAVVDRQRGELGQALARVEEALRIIESVRSQVSGERLRVTYLASKRSWYELYVDLQMRLEEEQPGQGHAAAALEASERARARGLLDLIAEGRIDVQEGIAPDLKRRESELGARLSWFQERLAEVIAQNAESGRVANLLDQLDRVGEESELLEQEVRRRHPRYAEVRYPTPLRLEQVEGVLDDRTALLEYFVGHEASFLFVVTRAGLSAYRLPPAEVLQGKVQDLRSVLGRPGFLTLGPFRRASGDLYRILWGPAAPQLARTPNVLISPDGPLTVIPFEVLLVDDAHGKTYKDLDYLLRDHAISYVPSASVLGSLQEPRPSPLGGASAAKELIAFGDPIVAEPRMASEAIRGASPLWPLPRLPGSEREVQAIARLYPEAEVALYLGANATEENVKANPLLQTARRVHFATHGVLDEAHPQLSGLVMSRPALSQGDGILRVFEIFNLRLHADLVTLSACETGLGEQVTGEGMVGLTRAFLYAGASSLLVSLWPVSDLSTPDLMTGFYRHLGHTGTKAEALRRAKLERIEAGDEPYRWSPFILGGDPR